jgi:hypothetical protein
MTKAVRNAADPAWKAKFEELATDLNAKAELAAIKTGSPDPAWEKWAEEQAARLKGKAEGEGSSIGSMVRLRAAKALANLTAKDIGQFAGEQFAVLGGREARARLLDVVMRTASTGTPDWSADRSSPESKAVDAILDDWQWLGGPFRPIAETSEFRLAFTLGFIKIISEHLDTP